MAHAEGEVVGFAALDDLVAAFDQLAFVVEEVIVRVVQFVVIFIVRLDAAAETFALDVVASFPSRNALRASISAGGLGMLPIGSVGIVSMLASPVFHRASRNPCNVFRNPVSDG